MSGVTIQFREEEKCLAKSHLAEMLKASSSTISRWIKKGKIPGPSGYNSKFTREDVETIFELLNHKPVIKLPRIIKKEWKESDFIIKDGGIFWVSPKATFGYDGWVEDLISEYGLWNAQGMNNHEHIDPIVKNPILQLIISKELIGYWVEQVRELQPEKKVIIYWTGLVDSVLCIYLMPEEGEEFLDQIDKSWGMRKCIVSEVEL